MLCKFKSKGRHDAGKLIKKEIKADVAYDYKFAFGNFNFVVIFLLKKC